MKPSRTRIALAAAIVLAAIAVPAIAALGSGKAQSLLRARQATARFQDLAVAERAGYGLFRDAKGIACIANTGGMGAMGVHYVNGSLVGDTVLDPNRPEALVYASIGHGPMHLAALEYIVFAEPWDKDHATRPSLFGQTFNFTPSPNRYGIPAFYSLHAWIWRNNVSGLLQPWNPAVLC